MAFETAHGCDNHSRIRRQPAVMTFEIPELFIADVSSKTGFRNMIFTELQANPVRDNRTLPNGDIGERPGMHKYGLPLHGLNKIWFKGVHHPGCHCAINFQIGRCYRLAPPVIGYNYGAHALTQIFQIPRNGQDGHDFA